MNIKLFAALAALVLSVVSTAQAQGRYIQADTSKTTIIAMIEPYVDTFNRVLKHPIGAHYLAQCQGWEEGTVRPVFCNDRRGGLVKRALIGSQICATYVQLLKGIPNDRVWAGLDASDIDYNNKVLEACIAGGEAVKPLINEQL